jgi:adenylate cyclase
MTYDVTELHNHLPEDQRLFYGVGVRTGSAVLGSVGSPERREFSAIGDAVDLSKLLQENAGRGEIMISAATYELVKDLFTCEPLPPRKTKDRTDFTVMYQVTGLRRKTGLLPSLDF